MLGVLPMHDILASLSNLTNATIQLNLNFSDKFIECFGVPALAYLFTVTILTSFYSVQSLIFDSLS